MIKLNHSIRSLYQNLNFIASIYCLLIVLTTACAAIDSAGGTKPSTDAPQTAGRVIATPTDFQFHSGLPEAPVPIGGKPGQEDNLSFSAALKQFSVRRDPDDTRALTDYLETHPESPWRVAVLTNLGLIQYDSGRFSGALEAFAAAWREAKPIAASGADQALVDRALGIPFSEPWVPQGLSPVFNAYVNGRNSFYWDKHALKMAPGDYTKARLTHWLHGVNTAVSVAVKESEKQPLENRVWYSYPGQTWGGFVAAGMIEKPGQIARVLDDGTTQRYQYDYNALAKVTRAVDPLGRETVYEYSPDGIDLLRVKQKNGASYEVLAEFTCNGRHRPLTYQDGGGAVTGFAWNGAGQLLSVTDALDHTTAYEYDAQGYLLRIVNALGHIRASFSYDSAGRIATATDESGYTLGYRYDDIGRVIRITYPDGTQQTRLFAQLDLASATDRLGRTTQYAYNPLRQVTQVTDALGWITQLTWCGCGSLETLTDALGKVTRFTHDVQGRLTARRYDDDRGIDYVYEATTSRLKSRTDALGQTTQYHYALDDAVTDITYANAVQATADRHFQYDPAYPRLVAFDNGRGISTLRYHPAGQPGAGRLAGETGPDAFGIAYDYDVLGRPQTTAVIQPDGTQLPDFLSYDVLGRIIESDTNLGAFRYAYHADSSRLARIFYPNHAETRFGYLEAPGDFRLKTLNHFDPRSVLFAGNRYASDTEGQITTWRRTGTETVRESFGYDAVGQLIEVTTRNGRHPDENYDDHRRPYHAYDHGQHIGFGHLAHGKGRDQNGEDDDRGSLRAFYAYAYDAAGNRIRETIGGRSTEAAYNPLNQLAANGNDRYSHDLEGNQSERHSQTLGDRRYRWDAENRLIAVEDPHNPTTRSDFEYDALGRRIRVQDQIDGALTQDSRLVYCTTALCGAEDQTNSGLTRYYGNGASQDGQSRYYHGDHLGSVRAVTDASGTVKASYAYDPYGRRSVLTGNPTDSAFGYTGHYVHAATGLTLAPYRTYDANIGRWISRDPIGEAGGINLYGYVGNNPTNHTDSSRLIIDTLADLGFILYDLYKLGSDGACQRDANLTSLGLDIIGAITPGATGLGAASRVAMGSTNPIPQRVARVIDADLLEDGRRLGAPGAGDAFVTACDDLAGLTSSTGITERLTLLNRVGELRRGPFAIIEFDTPSGIASPVFRTDPGFIGFGRTTGGAREFVVPNLRLDELSNVTTRVVP
ncbi:MAG: polymorphic toxin type 10 domain-containing protein [Methylococcales bacterium]